jgi:hypothetical protein
MSLSARYGPARTRSRPHRAADHRSQPTAAPPPRDPDSAGARRRSARSAPCACRLHRASCRGASGRRVLELPFGISSSASHGRSVVPCRVARSVSPQYTDPPQVHPHARLVANLGENGCPCRPGRPSRRHLPELIQQVHESVIGADRVEVGFGCNFLGALPAALEGLAKRVHGAVCVVADQSG